MAKNIIIEQKKSIKENYRRVIPYEISLNDFMKSERRPDQNYGENIFSTDVYVGDKVWAFSLITGKYRRGFVQGMIKTSSYHLKEWNYQIRFEGSRETIWTNRVNKSV